MIWASAKEVERERKKKGFGFSHEPAGKDSCQQHGSPIFHLCPWDQVVRDTPSNLLSLQCQLSAYVPVLPIVQVSGYKICHLPNCLS